MMFRREQFHEINKLIKVWVLKIRSGRYSIVFSASMHVVESHFASDGGRILRE